MEHFFGSKPFSREALPVAKLKHLVDLSAAFLETPNIEIRTRQFTLFFPQTPEP
jgi:hypothetical protein